MGLIPVWYWINYNRLSVETIDNKGCVFNGYSYLGESLETECLSSLYLSFSLAHSLPLSPFSPPSLSLSSSLSLSPSLSFSLYLRT